jgi:murein DD-endopeptidase MepM/ murein hydrolase activator NlpD
MDRRIFLVGAALLSIPAGAEEGAPGVELSAGGDAVRPRRYWPVVTSRRQALDVPNTNATEAGRDSRGYDAGRAGAARRHVGVDLYARPSDAVIAIEAGRIIAFYPFYRDTWALMIAHPGYVANYGEVRDGSLARRLHVGASVRAGQRIATIGATGALHFELYRPGAQRNAVWRKGAPEPMSALDPTAFLQALARDGVRLRPGDRTS